MDIREIREYWGERLHTYNDQCLKLLDKNSQNYLQTIGIPKFQESFGYYKFLFELESIDWKGKTYVKIANSHNDIELCIDVQSGFIINLNKAHDEYTYYVNKDIETFIKCITYEYRLTHKYSQLRDFPKYTCPYKEGVREKELFDYACELYRCIKIMDEKAVEMKSVWNLWVAFLMEMADGEFDYHEEEINTLVDSGKYKSYEEAQYAFIEGKEILKSLL